MFVKLFTNYKNTNFSFIIIFIHVNNRLNKK